MSDEMKDAAGGDLGHTHRRRMQQSRIPSSVYKVIAFSVVTVLLLGVLATLIGNISFAPRRTYAAVFTDATGVNKGDRVRLSGVEVGTITSTELVKAGEATQARLEFTVDEAVPLYRSARLELRYENIVGQRYLAIEEEPGDGPVMPEGGTFGTGQTTPALNLTALFNGFQPLFRALEPAQLNRLSDQLVRTLQGESGTYRDLLASTAELTDELADRDEVIGDVVSNLSTVLGAVESRDARLTALIVTFRDLMSGLAQDRDAIGTSLGGLGSLLDGSAGFVREVRGPLAADVRQLRTLTAALEKDRAVLDESLGRLPRKLRALGRTGSYGSYFNFHVCGAEISVQLLGGSYTLSSPSVAANEDDTACSGRSR